MWDPSTALHHSRNVDFWKRYDLSTRHDHNTVASNNPSTSINRLQILEFGIFILEQDDPLTQHNGQVY
jgi:hypothetical protein